MIMKVVCRELYYACIVLVVVKMSGKVAWL